MRDLLVVLIVFGSIPMIFVRPFAGILVWTWLSLMNPHRLTWSYAYDLRSALVIGAVTLAAWILSREPKRPPATAATVFLALFTFWFSFANLFALLPAEAWVKWEQSIKIVGMTFVAMCLTQGRERVLALAWATAVSIGFYGIRGGLFTILTAGNYRVWGPANSFISDNNQLAVALIMIVPLLRYLQLVTAQRWLRLGLLGAMGLTVIAILGTYSRGGLVGLAAMLGVLWLGTRNKLVTGTAMALVLAGALAAAPDKWFDRMRTIETYQEDKSLQGRFDAWTFAWKLALDRPLTGGGMSAFSDARAFLRYVPTAPKNRNAHSIYFEVLGESGFIGLFLFLGLGASTLLGSLWLVRRTRDRPDLAWARDLGRMMPASIAGYAAGGAFVNLGFFDLYYTLVAIVVAAVATVRRTLAEPAPEPPAEAEPAPAAPAATPAAAPAATRDRAWPGGAPA